MIVIVMFNLSNSTVKTVLGFGAAVVGLRVLGNVMRSESFNAFTMPGGLDEESRMVGRSLSNDGTIALNTVILVDLSGSTSQGIGTNDKGETIMIADIFYEEVKAIVEINRRKLGNVTILGYGSQGGDNFLSGVHGRYTKKLSIYDRSEWTNMGGTTPISQELVEEIRNKLNMKYAPLQIINISDGLPNDYLPTHRAETFDAEFTFSYFRKRNL